MRLARLLTFRMRVHGGGKVAGPELGATYYERSDRQIDVSIPERRYDLMGSVLLRALGSWNENETGEEAARRAAKDAGLQITETIVDTWRLRSCPFHELPSWTAPSCAG